MEKLRSKLIEIARREISNTDVSHDIYHALRVLSNAETIAKAENADLEILTPAALFHDLVVYPKDHPQRHKSQEESADSAELILLNDVPEYPKSKIKNVRTCILECSFTKGIMPNTLESKILQDSDGLEVTGAIAIMRTFSSAGQMKRPFYNPDDPFCTNRDPSMKYSLDLFYSRLLKVSERMHTETARKMAEGRDYFLRQFLVQLKSEL